MRSLKTIRTVCGLVVFIGVIAASAFAQTFDKRTAFTFNTPIALPGVTLPAGQYLFRLPDPEGAPDVVQVLSADGKTPFAMLFSIPVERPDASSEPEVRFMETPKGTPAAIKTWWYVGERTGYEFVYPKAQARLLAKGNAEAVLTTRSETNKAEETRTKTLSRLTSTGPETKVTAMPVTSVPRGVRQIGTVASNAIPVSLPAQARSAQTRLPRTASTLPLVGLIGILTAAGAGSLRLWRTVRG